MKPRFFAVVLSVPENSLLDSPFFSASTDLGVMLRQKAHEFLPEGSRITRCIEITEETAVNGIR